MLILYLGIRSCSSELPKSMMWFAIGVPVLQFVDEEDVVPLCSARCSLVVVEQRKNRHVMSGIRKKVMGNGEVGQTKRGGVLLVKTQVQFYKRHKWTHE